MARSDRLRQTGQYYETYNALLEIKELMLKETSLLNSVESQFGDAIVNPAGRTKLIDSMEAILKGIQQKLEKVQLWSASGAKNNDALRERYSAAISNRRYCSILMKDFQCQIKYYLSVN
ncbi:Coiled-coil domain-containing protein 93-like protein [Bienertia sinuspersici]